ncbi:MAG: hypothetical protein D6814_04240 [Calditrichaeota bacterium]|nr:MAG: hypothetical protein D6814_04240 [Calditrichota bacterium]
MPTNAKLINCFKINLLKQMMHVKTFLTCCVILRPASVVAQFAEIRMLARHKGKFWAINAVTLM